jgi:hypothetical protein
LGIITIGDNSFRGIYFSIRNTSFPPSALHFSKPFVHWILNLDNEEEENCYRLKINDILLSVSRDADGFGTGKSVNNLGGNTEFVLNHLAGIGPSVNSETV